MLGDSVIAQQALEHVPGDPNRTLGICSQQDHDLVNVMLVSKKERIKAVMQGSRPKQADQTRMTATALQRVLGDALLAVYLHGSAVAGNLRPQSDIDLLAVIGRPMTDDQRRDLLRVLLRMSARHPAVPGGLRCLDVAVFLLSDLSESSVPTRAEFTYGEWLRDAFEAGESPLPTRDPEHTLVLAQTRRDAVSLIGPCSADLLPEMSPNHIRQAMGQALPTVLEGLRGDERNVLLTLVRMWHTAQTGAFVTKDAAAAWAIPRVPDQDATILDEARRAYLGELVDEWDSRRDDTQRLAEHLRARITKLL